MLVLTTSWCVPPTKPGIIRVVFGCSVQYANMSINTELMSGPDFPNQIIGVLLRFWKEHVRLWQRSNPCFTKFWYLHNKEIFYLICDGKKAVFQRKLLTIRCAHVFGGPSSRSCSNFALKKAATDSSDKFG